MDAICKITKRCFSFSGRLFCINLIYFLFFSLGFYAAGANDYVCRINKECLQFLHNSLLKKESTKSIYHICDKAYRGNEECCQDLSRCNESYGKSISKDLRENPSAVFKKYGDVGRSCQLNEMPRFLGNLSKIQDSFCEKGEKLCKQSCEGGLRELTKLFKRCFFIEGSQSISGVLRKAKVTSSEESCYRHVREVVKKYKEQSLSRRAIFADVLKSEDIVSCGGIKKRKSQSGIKSLALNICQSSAQGVRSQREEEEPAGGQLEGTATGQDKGRKTASMDLGHVCDFYAGDTQEACKASFSSGDSQDTLKYKVCGISPSKEEQTKCLAQHSGGSSDSSVGSSGGSIASDNSSGSRSNGGFGGFGDSGKSGSSLHICDMHYTIESEQKACRARFASGNNYGACNVYNSQSKRDKCAASASGGSESGGGSVGSGSGSSDSSGGSEESNPSRPEPTDPVTFKDCEDLMPEIKSVVVYQSVEAPQIEPMNQQASLPYDNYDLVQGKPAGVWVRIAKKYSARQAAQADLLFKISLDIRNKNIASCKMLSANEIGFGAELRDCSIRKTNTHTQIDARRFFTFPMKDASLNREVRNIPITAVVALKKGSSKCTKTRTVKINIVKTPELNIGFTGIEANKPGQRCNSYASSSLNTVNRFVRSREVYDNIASMFPVNAVKARVSQPLVSGACGGSTYGGQFSTVMRDIDTLNARRLNEGYHKMVTIASSGYFINNGMSRAAGFVLIGGNKDNIAFVREDTINMGVVLHELGHTFGQLKEYYRADHTCQRFNGDRPVPCSQYIVSRFLKATSNGSLEFGAYPIKSVMHSTTPDVSRRWIDRDTYQKIFSTLSSSSFRANRSKYSVLKIITSGYYHEEKDSFVISAVRTFKTVFLTPSFSDKGKAVRVQLRDKKGNILQEIKQPVVKMMIKFISQTAQHLDDIPLPYSYTMAALDIPRNKKIEDLRVAVISPRGKLMYSAAVPNPKRSSSDSSGSGQVPSGAGESSDIGGGSALSAGDVQGAGLSGDTGTDSDTEKLNNTSGGGVGSVDTGSSHKKGSLKQTDNKEKRGDSSAALSGGGGSSGAGSGDVGNGTAKNPEAKAQQGSQTAKGGMKFLDDIQSEEDKENKAKNKPVAQGADNIFHRVSARFQEMCRKGEAGCPFPFRQKRGETDSSVEAYDGSSGVEREVSSVPGRDIFGKWTIFFIIFINLFFFFILFFKKRKSRKR